MVEGNAEGIIIINPETGSNVNITKWKIGAEPNQNNI